MRVLVTGGAGFLGSHLCETLLQRGHNVICLDNLLTGRIENISPFLDHQNFRFLHYNVCDYLHVDGQLDAILHFASPASPQDYLEYPIATLKVGALGTHKALGLAKAKQSRFLLASTSEVYGDPLVNPQPETYWGNVNPISPRGVYDEAKRFAEALTTAYHRFHGLDTRIVRIFNTYGPRMRPNDGRVVSNFIVQAIRGKPLSVYGDGSQTRSFCYVDDLVDGIIALLLAPGGESRSNQSMQDAVRRAKVAADPNSIHSPVNIGNPQELSVLEIAKTIIQQTGSSSEITFHPLPIDDPKVRRPNIDKAKALLKWEPQITLQQGLSKTIEFFKHHLAHHSEDPQ
jgi:dTDP-glucose 4,6-dehydratase